MKKQLLFILFSIICAVSINAQTQLWGTAMGGGAYGDGTIFYCDASGNNFQLAYNIHAPAGRAPVGKLVLADNNSLYGECLHGGATDSCVIYRFNPSTGVYTMIYDFFVNPSQGVGNLCGMVKGADAMLYGAGAGGTNNAGVIYKVNPQTDTYTKIYDFVAATGSSPTCSMIKLNDGKLYGMTYNGGANAAGVIFSYDPAASGYTMLYSLDSVTGAHPLYGGLFQASNGKLYGMTSAGGAYSVGVIFSFDLSTMTYNVLHDFDWTTGVNPQSTFVQASNGLLYGTTYSGGAHSKGVLFSFDILANTFTTLVDFDSINGEHPRRGVTLCSNGLLFGTTMEGGINGTGVAYKFDISTNTFTKILDFSPATTGSIPNCEFLETPLLMIPTAIPQAGGSSLNIYPNPANNVLTVGASGKEEIIFFYDITGRELATVKTSSLQRTSVDVSAFPNFFILKTQSGEVRKLVRE